MKKSGINLSIKLLIISLGTVMALTACERRERPVKAKAGVTESLGEAKRMPQNGENGSNGNVDGEKNEAISEAAKAYLKSVEELEIAQNILDQEGYVLDSDAKILDITAPWETYSKSDAGPTKDQADSYVACHLKGLLKLHEAFVRDHKGAKAEGVSETAYLAQIEKSEAMIEILVNTIHDKRELEQAICEVPATDPASEASVPAASADHEE